MAAPLSSKTFKFELVAPERMLASEDVVMVTLPGDEGEFGVLDGHAPVVSSLRPGVIAVQMPSGEMKNIFVSGGVADVTGALCTVLAEEAVNVNDIDRAAVEKRLEELRSELAGTIDDVAKADFARDIAIAEAKRAAA
ncbi:MAG: ATP synthase F1 subunit epsilon [Alphaproteobacteria bacterium]|nr:ATP synthase F1 subunit epsilon [Alphaproteobacteria bacterium]MDE2337615.1 ATP synthase F1 subunit epsilon [Alphaproteobacteria bacterium]